jgi:hypothetical protein
MMNVTFAQFGGPSHGGPPAIFVLFFVAIFAIVLGSIVFKAVQGMNEWASNNAQPERSDEAEIVSKRTEVSGGQKSTSTTYYATFELAGGERKELEVKGRDYGLFAEGDRGQLRHQGTRFLGFMRQLEREEAPPPIAGLEIPANLVCAYCGSAIPAGKIKCDGCGWTWKPGRAETVEASS